MKTVQCYKCKNEVEKNKKICPVCGGPIVTHYSIGWLFFGIVILIIAIGYYVGISPKSTQSGDLSVKAFIIAQNYVEDRLKTPSVAKFGPYNKNLVENLGNNRYEVLSYVDSQNQFGAMLRTHYKCWLKYNGGHVYVQYSCELEDIKFKEQ